MLVDDFNDAYLMTDFADAYKLAKDYNGVVVRVECELKGVVASEFYGEEE